MKLRPVQSDLGLDGIADPMELEVGIGPDGAELEIESSEAITEPFDPTKIRVRMWTPTIDLLMTRLGEGEINLIPEFQRHSGIWSDADQSRLIESILIRIPLPAFYMDATDEDHLLVIDGNQRLTALKRFILNQELYLQGLEFLADLKNSTYTDLPRQLKRRISETQVTVYLIEKGTPESVKFNIFKRINTGGLPLSPQEIRHALNQGPATKLLETLAKSEEFIRATERAVSERRMADRECVLRFLTFATRPLDQYRSTDLDGYLSQAMSEINRMSDAAQADLDRRFRRAVRAAHQVFGRCAFRKYDRGQARRGPINKALFEAWSANLDTRTDDDLALLVQRREQVQKEFEHLLSADREFEASISVGTAQPVKVHIRFQRIGELIDRVLQ